jgi:hypothetical protein
MYVNLRSSRPTCGSEVIVTAISRIWPRSLCPRGLRSKPERAEASGIAAVPMARPLTCGFGARPNGLPHDRQRERLYSTLLLPESPPADQRGRASRRESGLPPSAMRPCAPAWEAAESTDAHGRRGWERCAGHPKERYADRPAWCLAAELPFQVACSLSPSPPRQGRARARRRRGRR